MIKETTFQEILDCVQNHKRMSKEARPYELLTELQLREYFIIKSRVENGQMDVDPKKLEDRLQEIRRSYAVNKGAYERGEAAIKRMADFFLNVEYTANNYIMNPSRQTANELWKACSSLTHIEEGEEYNADFMD